MEIMQLRKKLLIMKYKKSLLERRVKMKKKINLETFLKPSEKRGILKELNKLFFSRSEPKQYEALTLRFAEKYNMQQYEVQSLMNNYEISRVYGR